VSAARPAREPVKVIYVMGSGHSGSTILGVALGNCEGMFFAGELDEYLARSGIPVLGGLERTRLWAAVRERAPEARTLFGARVHGLLERSSAVLRVHRFAQARALRARYRVAAASVFAAIAEVADARWVIDTSHFPLRARELQRTPGVELYLIFLVREPQAVVASTTRLLSQHDVARRQRMTVEVNADLWLTHALALEVFARQPPPRRMLVRYEDLASAPEAVLSQILEHFGTGVGLPDLGSLRTGLAIHANRLIESEAVAFKRSRDSHPARGEVSALTSLMQRPWRALFARLRPAASRTGTEQPS
jgi:Sulfotransferase family